MSIKADNRVIGSGSFSVLFFLVYSAMIVGELLSIDVKATLLSVYTLHCSSGLSSYLE